MAHTVHSTTRRPARIDREGSTRTLTRNALRNGDWDSLETTQSSRLNRRGYLA